MMNTESTTTSYNELLTEAKGNNNAGMQRKPVWRFRGRGERKQRADGSFRSHSQQSGAQDFADEGDDEEEVYVVKQRWGYCSIVFSLVQLVILIIMMVKCGIAPLNINPMVGPYPDVLSDWGGKNAVFILEDGEWWRLFTPILLHAGVIHLLCNVAVQLETGAFFEREWGSATWLAIYLVSAVGSSILSVIAMPNSISVGSSGAVMGLFGGKLSEAVLRSCESTQTRQDRIGHDVRKEQLTACLCSVLIVGLFSFIPYVDWAAHLGGLIGGILIGIPVFAMHIESVIWRSVLVLFGAAATIVCFVFALSYMYGGNVEAAEELRDVCGYYKQFFDDYECVCAREGQK